MNSFKTFEKEGPIFKTSCYWIPAEYQYCVCQRKPLYFICRINHGGHRWSSGHFRRVGLCGVCWNNSGGSWHWPIPGHPRSQGDQQRGVLIGWTANDSCASCHVSHCQLHVWHHSHWYTCWGLPVRICLLALWLRLRYHVCNHCWDFCSSFLQTGDHQRLWGREMVQRLMDRWSYEWGIA